MAKKEVLKKDSMITVMNNTFGGLIYVNPRTQQIWELEGYGATDEMPLSELITMKSSQPKFINEAWLLILNEEAVEYLGLKKLYANIVKPEEIDAFLNSTSEKIVEILEKAPNNMKMLIGQLVKDKISKGEFGDLFKIKLIQSILKIDLLEE